MTAAQLTDPVAGDIVAPCLYDADLGHTRMVPQRREFSYRVYYWLVDLDHLPLLPRWQRPLARFEARDHLGDPRRSIKENVLQFLAAHGIDLTGGRVLMLANARSFGHVFNPLTVHWCYDRAGDLACILAEVHNTYGERHGYLLQPDQAGRVQQDKDFYVSPFLGNEGRYLMRFAPPTERLSVTIALQEGGRTVFSATLKGTRRPATTRQLLREAARRPAMSLLTSFWIRVQGIRLWAARHPVTKRHPMTKHHPPASKDHAMTNLTAATSDPPAEGAASDGLAADPSGGLSAAPAGGLTPVRRAAAGAVLRHAARQLPVRVRFPDGTEIGAGTDRDPVMMLHRPREFMARLGTEAKIGFGEAYMAGDWSPAAGVDLADLLTPFAEHLTELVPRPLQSLRRWVDRRQPRTEVNTQSQARRNIHRHYDLSNELFATFLDETLTYSSAWFESGDTLADAQQRKIDGILDYAGVADSSRVLEIGTGWGELAIRAAQRGAHVVSVTLSGEQLDLARQRVAAAGVADRVDLRLADYRDVDGSFDAVVSIEMIEAVGRQYWPLFFQTIDRVLAPGGRVGLQAITMPHRQMLASSRSYTWIHKYIFPGGIVPSVQAIEETVAAHTSLTISDRRSLGRHYATTLRQWRERFTAAQERVAELGFDEQFRRMWEFYLAYSEAGFRAGYLDVVQFRMVR